MSYKNMNKAKKYDDKRIKALLNPHLKKDRATKIIFMNDEVKQKLNIDSPDNFFEVEVNQQAMFEEAEEHLKILNDFNDFLKE